MDWKYRKIALEQLDEKCHNFNGLCDITLPSKGWIKSIREAFGMTLKQLGERANGMLPESVSRLEKQEVSGSTTIKTMETIAHALNCRFVYAFVPQSSFQELVMEQAKTAARNKISYISHSMRLEDQQVSESEIQKQIEELAIELLRKKPKLIWEKSNI